MWPEYETDIIEGKYIFRCDPEYSIKAIKVGISSRAVVCRRYCALRLREGVLRNRYTRFTRVPLPRLQNCGHLRASVKYFAEAESVELVCRTVLLLLRVALTSCGIEGVFVWLQVAYERNLNTHKSEWSWRLTLAQYIEDGGYYSKRKSALNDYMDCSCKWYASVVNPEFSGKKSENQQEVVADVGQGKLEVREVGLVLNLDGRRP
eukprot:scaffold1102_cov395-Prasinococcus_capsulatus_cf.AAC.7